jgi:hypothetical protein
MSKAIYKYQLNIHDIQTVCLPKGAKIIHIAEQFGFLCLWAEVWEDADDCEIDIMVRGTGHTFTGHENYHLGTVLMSNGLVWHVYCDLLP